MSNLAFWYHTQRVGGLLNACRVATDANMTAIATLNESVLNPRGRPRGKAGRRALVRKGRAATGDADRAGFNQGHVDEYHGAMFPTLPMPTLVETRDWPNLMAHLSDGYVIAVAVDLAAHAALRRFVSGAGHEVGLVRRKRVGKAWELKVVDPAHPPSDTYLGHWVPEAAVRKGAKAILDGIVVAELYPVGGWTQAALQTERLRKRTRAQAATIAEKQRTIERVRKARDDCRARLEACESGTDHDLGDCIDRTIEHLQETRP